MGKEGHGCSWERRGPERSLWPWGVGREAGTLRAAGLEEAEEEILGRFQKTVLRREHKPTPPNTT